MKQNFNPYDRRIRTFTKEKPNRDLTAKQYAVYCYLVSKALVDKRELYIEKDDDIPSDELYQQGHYYLYFNRMNVIKDSQEIGINKETYSRAVKILLEKGYISTPWYDKQREYLLQNLGGATPMIDLTPEQKDDVKKIKKEKPWYHIPIPDTYIQLSQFQISQMFEFGKVFFGSDAKMVGDMIGILGVLYKTWKIGQQENEFEWINATEIEHILHRTNGAKHPRYYYHTIIWYLMAAGIVDAKQEIKKNPFNHKNFIDFQIRGIDLNKIDKLDFGDEPVRKIIEKIDGLKTIYSSLSN